MAVDVALPSVPRSRALARGLTARAGLAGIVALSFALRVVAAAAHPTPRYFPDEYIYAAIGRSLGSSGRPLVRGEAAHFPALLEPLLAAPLWRLFDPALAYRLVQAENALAMSLAAVPVFLLARRLGLGARWSLACAAFAVALPDLVFSSYTLADPIAYPLALGAVAAAVWALETRAPRAQLAFVALAGLAALARVQYVALPLAFVVGAVVVERRRVLRAQALPLALFATPVLLAAALGPARLLGYYSGVSRLGVDGDVARWALRDLFLLVLASGVVLVPGAVAGMLRARGRAEVAFASVGAAFGAGLLAEAALYAADGSNRFQERYLFALLPLAPLAFGLWVKNGRPWPRLVVGVSFVVLVAAARVPLSGYAAADGKTDSPFLVAVFKLETAVGTANGSLLVALLASAAAAAAAVVAWRGGERYAFAAALAVCVVTSAAAVSNDARNAKEIRATHLPSNPSWVDAHRFASVTAVQTLGSPPDRLLEQLFWNPSIRHEVLLANALPTDAFATPHVRIARDGTLGGIRGPVLFQEFGVTAQFEDADLVERAGTLALWRPLGPARLHLLADGRYWDGWLARGGSVAVWPDESGRARGVVSFTISLPRTAPAPVEIRLGRVQYTIEPGAHTRLRYRIDRRGPWQLRFKSLGGTFRPDLRPVSVKMSEPRFVRAGAASVPTVRVDA
ncbi:MAG TPA: hypothetical protein VGJ77_08915 [Gaiellaceae bacterium]